MSERAKAQAGRRVQGPMLRSRSPSLGPALALTALTACSCGAASPTPAPGATPPDPPPAGATYEVHEWGLVRGTAADGVMLSGPYATPEPMPVAKPVLYFHRAGEGVLEIDVEVRIPSGRILEHWPLAGGSDPGAAVVWRDVRIEAGTCPGSRYPRAHEIPCIARRDRGDACESAELRAVEAADADCLRWGSAPGDGGPEAWNHLFYRGEVDGTPNVGLRIEPQPDGSLRVTSTSGDPIPGRIVRVHRAGGWGVAPDSVAVFDPPAPGESVLVPAASEPVGAGVEALAGALGAAGLTLEEIAAFRRAWDRELFGDLTVAAAEPAPTSTPVASASPMPVVPPHESSALLYVLPRSAADGLAELDFEPAPTAVRRAIVAWIDETRAP